MAVVVGSHDAPVFAAAEATAAQIVGSTFRVLDGMAHLPMLEAPSVVAAEIRTLLRRVEEQLPSSRGDGRDKSARHLSAEPESTAPRRRRTAGGRGPRGFRHGAE